MRWTDPFQANIEAPLVGIKEKHSYKTMNTESCSRPTRHGHAWKETSLESKADQKIDRDDLHANHAT
jgi:hypothetical protein